MIMKKGQEEMVGFVLIVIIVAILILVFIGFSLRAPQVQDVESYEVESFIQSTLQYTSDCQDNFGYLTVDDLIFDCVEATSCVDGRKTCDVLLESLEGISEESWRIENRPLEGYELKVSYEGEDLISEINEGNQTNNYKGSVQDFSKGGRSIQVFFRAYY